MKKVLVLLLLLFQCGVFAMDNNKQKPKYIYTKKQLLTLKSKTEKNKISKSNNQEMREMLEMLQKWQSLQRSKL